MPLTARDNQFETPVQGACPLFHLHPEFCSGSFAASDPGFRVLTHTGPTMSSPYRQPGDLLPTLSHLPTNLVRRLSGLLPIAFEGSHPTPPLRRARA